MDGCGHATAGFTKANELFVGRVAMIGFAASLVGEYFQNGKGPLGQLGTLSERPCRYQVPYRPVVIACTCAFQVQTHLSLVQNVVVIAVIRYPNARLR